mmetsp:Transcript_2410/g.5236  ORF Transcript_2410/g.5236 Transcript_2410/m.5236 type:complete len:96 (-) Transcript_2410:780-1067(-)
MYPKSTIESIISVGPSIQPQRTPGVNILVNELTETEHPTRLFLFAETLEQIFDESDCFDKTWSNTENRAGRLSSLQSNKWYTSSATTKIPKSLAN